MSAINLKSLSPSEVKAIFEGFDTILSDCDGVLYHLNIPIKGVPETVKKLKNGGKRFTYVTNNPLGTRNSFSATLQTMGYDAEPEQIVCVSYLVATYLKSIDFDKKVYLIGCNGMGQELDAVGISHTGIGPDPVSPDLKTTVQNFVPDPEVGAVVVGFDEHFSYPKVMRAASYLNNPDVHFIATSMDIHMPIPGSVLPGTGPFIKCIEVCSMRKPTVLGKPEPYIRKIVTENHGADPERTLFIGDSLHTDILMGKRCGFKTLLVLSGLTSEEAVKSLRETNNSDSAVDSRELFPDYYIDSLADVFGYL